TASVVSTTFKITDIGSPVAVVVCPFTVGVSTLIADIGCGHSKGGCQLTLHRDVPGIHGGYGIVEIPNIPRDAIGNHRSAVRTETLRLRAGRVCDFIAITSRKPCSRVEADRPIAQEKRGVDVLRPCSTSAVFLGGQHWQVLGNNVAEGGAENADVV